MTDERKVFIRMIPTYTTSGRFAGYRPVGTAHRMTDAEAYAQTGYWEVVGQEYEACAVDGPPEPHENWRLSSADMLVRGGLT